MSDMTSYLKIIQQGRHLKTVEAEALLGDIIDDDTVSDGQIKSMLTALSTSSPSIDEIVGFIHAMRRRMITISAPEDAIDMCGTGGDRSGTFNISTASSLIVAAGGAPVAKHGNRAATSKCGSADVLEALHIPIGLTPVEAERTLHDTNFVFLFAPQYHPSLKRMSVIRKELGFPTIFNLLGPLLNPAKVKKQVIGTFSSQNAELLASVALRLGFDHLIVLTSIDGLDEAGLDAPVHLFEVRHGTVDEQLISARQFGFDPAKNEALTGGSPEENASIIRKLLDPDNTSGPTRSVAVFNAALGFYVSGVSADIEGGIALATDTIENGNAYRLLNKIKSEN